MQNVSENSLDLINQGCALMAQQQYEQALAKFLLAQKDSPKYIDCYVKLQDYVAVNLRNQYHIFIHTNSVEVLKYEWGIK